MSRSASSEEEILNYVSKKLATAQLSQRRPMSQPVSRSSSSRVAKSSSKQASPSRQLAKTNFRSSVANAGMIYTERPLSWHTTTGGQHEQPMSTFPALQYQDSQSYSFTQLGSSYDLPGHSQISRPITWHTGSYTNPTALPSFMGGNNSSTSSNMAYPFSTRQVSHCSNHFGSNYAVPQAATTLPSQPKQKSRAQKDKGSRAAGSGSGEVLVGLGLYEKTAKAIPKQLCAALPSSFVPNGSYGLTEKEQSPEETWQQLPEWQHFESSDGSEASHSPFEEFYQYTPPDDYIDPLQHLQDYTMDSTDNAFLVPDASDWVVNSDQKSLPHYILPSYDYTSFDGSSYASYN